MHSPHALSPEARTPAAAKYGAQEGFRLPDSISVTRFAMARAVVFLICALVLLAATAESHILQGFTTAAPKVFQKPAYVKLVVHNVADRTVTFTCAELGEDSKPVSVETGKWTAIGPVEVTLVKNSVLHLTVTVSTGKRYGSVTKSLMINLLKEFRYNLQGSRFLVLTLVENPQQRILKLSVERRVALTFNLY